MPTTHPAARRMKANGERRQDVRQRWTLACEYFMAYQICRGHGPGIMARRARQKDGTKSTHRHTLSWTWDIRALTQEKYTTRIMCSRQTQKRTYTWTQTNNIHKHTHIHKCLRTCTHARAHKQTNTRKS